jgi:hypothetical protein
MLCTGLVTAGWPAASVHSFPAFSQAEANWEIPRHPGF